MSDIYRCILCIVGFSMTKLHSHRVKLRLGKDGFDDETSSWVLSHLGPFCWFLDCPWLSIYPFDSICLSMSTLNYIHIGHVALQGETVHHSHPWPVDRRGLWLTSDGHVLGLNLLMLGKLWNKIAIKTVAPIPSFWKRNPCHTMWLFNIAMEQWPIHRWFMMI
jgi:hypothetical protein